MELLLTFEKYIKAFNIRASEEWTSLSKISSPLFFFVFLLSLFFKTFFQNPTKPFPNLDLVDITSFLFFGLLDNTLNMRVIKAIAEKRRE
jgi:hypothetical protein